MTTTKCASKVTRLVVGVTPEDPNPYQGLLYSSMECEDVEVRYLTGPTLSHTINLLLMPLMLVYGRFRGLRILHIHWWYEFQLPWLKPRRSVRLALEVWFYFYIWSAKMCRIKVVWTAHNLYPHHQTFADDHRALGRLIQAASAIVALSNSSAKRLRELGASQVEVIPMGSYATPGTRSKPAEAHAQLGIGAGVTMLLFFGKIESYKGLERLIEAAAMLPPSSNCHIYVFGECRSNSYRAFLTEKMSGVAERVTANFGRVPDSEIETLFSAADFAVFPFQEVTNSSSVVTACSYGKPVIIPELDELSDIPADCAFRYDGSTEGLRDALLDAERSLPASRSAMASRATAFANRVDWRQAARLHAKLYWSLVDG